MSDFNLHQLIRDTIRQSDSPDPHTIAVEVANQIPPIECPIVLASLLPSAVREQIRGMRYLLPVEKLHEAPTALRGGNTGNRSRKNQKAAEQAASPFTWRVCVPPDTWVFFGDCTREQCELIAADYFSKASSHTVMGTRYQRVVHELKPRQKVKSLGEDRVREIWEKT